MVTLLYDGMLQRMRQYSLPCFRMSFNCLHNLTELLILTHESIIIVNKIYLVEFAVMHPTGTSLVS